MSSNAQAEKQKAERAERQRRFLEVLRGENGVPVSVRVACEAVGVARTTVRMWRGDDPEFAEAYADAMDDGTDLLEDAAVRRAVEGVQQPIYQGGEHVGDRTVYSDGLLQTMLAGRRPEKFRTGADVSVAVNNNVSGPLDMNQVARALALLLATAKHNQISS